MICSLKLAAFAMLAVLSTHLIAGDLRYTIHYPGLAEALGAGDEANWMFCGDDKINLTSKFFPKHFFVGPDKTGIVLKDFPNYQIPEWHRTLSAQTFNATVTKAIKQSILITVSEEGLKTRLFPNLDSTIQIPETLKDCRESGPKTFQCNPASKITREGCCSEFLGKTFGFEVRWADPTRVENPWRLRYTLNIGGSTISKLSSNEPLRFCVTNGITWVRPAK